MIGPGDKVSRMSDAPPSSQPEEQADLLDTCPACAYSLVGLPVEHRCPECGMEVDRRWTIFGGRGLTRSVGRPVRLVNVVLLPLFTAFSVMFLLLGRRGPGWRGVSLMAGA
ncbi:MAG: hypothetical protein D6788_11525, partial [Planctomycetota bacterium]